MNERHIIQPKWIAPVVPKGKVLNDCSVVIENGRIHEILTSREARQRYPNTAITELPDHLLVPSFVNLHGHAAMSLLRGYADDLPLMDWLNQHIWPAEARWANEDFCEDGVRLAAAEMIRGGVGCFSDMYFFPEASARVAINSGLRAQLAFPIIDFPSNWAESGDAYLEKGLALRDQMTAHTSISVCFGPHAPYTVSDPLLRRISELSNELDATVHIHLHETAQEVEDSLREYGKRPIERIADLDLLGPKTQCVHMTQLIESDIELLAQYNAHVVHCPHSNLKLASGFCPLGALRDAGVNVAIGTDGAASNNRLDLLSEARTAALLAKAVSQNATTLNAHETLEMLTLNGAKAMTMDQEFGSIEPGKSADLTAINLGKLATTPVYDPVSALIYTAQSQDISDVWVRGRRLLDNSELTTLSASSICHRANQWRAQIQEHA